MNVKLKSFMGIADFILAGEGDLNNTGVLERAREASPFVRTNDHRLG